MHTVVSRFSRLKGKIQRLMAQIRVGGARALFQNANFVRPKSAGGVLPQKR